MMVSGKMKVFCIHLNDQQVLKENLEYKVSNDQQVHKVNNEKLDQKDLYENNERNEI